MTGRVQQRRTCRMTSRALLGGVLFIPVARGKFVCGSPRRPQSNPPPPAAGSSGAQSAYVCPRFELDASSGVCTSKSGAVFERLDTDWEGYPAFKAVGEQWYVFRDDRGTSDRGDNIWWAHSARASPRRHAQPLCSPQDAAAMRRWRGGRVPLQRVRRHIQQFLS